MARKRYKIVVSDFHIGGGEILPDGTLNYLEDFHHGGRFAEFLNYYSTGEFEKAEVELICNGDFYNHLFITPDEVDPDVITEKVALRRMKVILEVHTKVTQAMRNFAATPHHRITFLLGNHDPGFLWPAVRQLLKDAFGEETQIRLEPYFFEGIHVEHGHRFFADSAYDTRKYFLSKNLPEPILNLPWGSFFVIHYLSRVKKERPYFDKVHPFRYYLRWALLHDTVFALKSIIRIVSYFIWLRFRKDPRRRSPVLATLRIIHETTISASLTKPAKDILLNNRNCNVVIMGHTHNACLKQFAPGKYYINTGLWNEKVGLDPQHIGKILRFTYAFIEYGDDSLPRASLKMWKGTHRIIEDIAY